MDTNIFTNELQMSMIQMLTKLMEQNSVNTSSFSSVSDSQKGGGIILGGSYQTGTTSSLTGNFAEIIEKTAAKYNVDPTLVQSIIKAESNFDASAVSSAGALGLMQLMPATAASLGVSDPLNPEQNIEGGVKFLSKLLSRYNGNVSLALAAYNAGPGAVDQYGGIPPYAETQTYVNRVLGYMKTSSYSWSA